MAEVEGIEPHALIIKPDGEQATDNEENQPPRPAASKSEVLSYSESSHGGDAVISVGGEEAEGNSSSLLGEAVIEDVADEVVAAHDSAVVGKKGSEADAETVDTTESNHLVGGSEGEEGACENQGGSPGAEDGAVNSDSSPEIPPTDASDEVTVSEEEQSSQKEVKAAEQDGGEDGPCVELAGDSALESPESTTGEKDVAETVGNESDDEAPKLKQEDTVNSPPSAEMAAADVAEDEAVASVGQDASNQGDGDNDPIFPDESASAVVDEKDAKTTESVANEGVEHRRNLESTPPSEAETGVVAGENIEASTGGVAGEEHGVEQQAGVESATPSPGTEKTRISVEGTDDEDDHKPEKPSEVAAEAAVEDDGASLSEQQDDAADASPVESTAEGSRAEEMGHEDDQWPEQPDEDAAESAAEDDGVGATKQQDNAADADPVKSAAEDPPAEKIEREDDQRQEKPDEDAANPAVEDVGASPSEQQADAADTSPVESVAEESPTEKAEHEDDQRPEKRDEDAAESAVENDGASRSEQQGDVADASPVESTVEESPAEKSQHEDDQRPEKTDKDAVESAVEDDGVSCPEQQSDAADASPVESADESPAEQVGHEDDQRPEKSDEDAAESAVEDDGAIRSEQQVDAADANPVESAQESPAEQVGHDDDQRLEKTDEDVANPAVGDEGESPSELQGGVAAASPVESVVEELPAENVEHEDDQRPEKPSEGAESAGEDDGASSHRQQGDAADSGPVVSPAEELPAAKIDDDDDQKSAELSADAVESAVKDDGAKAPEEQGDAADWVSGEETDNEDATTAAESLTPQEDLTTSATQRDSSNPLILEQPGEDAQSAPLLDPETDVAAVDEHDETSADEDLQRPNELRAEVVDLPDKCASSPGGYHAQEEPSVGSPTTPSNGDQTQVLINGSEVEVEPSIEEQNDHEDMTPAAGEDDEEQGKADDASPPVDAIPAGKVSGEDDRRVEMQDDFAAGEDLLASRPEVVDEVPASVEEDKKSPVSTVPTSPASNDVEDSAAPEPMNPTEATSTSLAVAEPPPDYVSAVDDGDKASAHRAEEPVMADVDSLHSPACGIEGETGVDNEDECAVHVVGTVDEVPGWMKEREELTLSYAPTLPLDKATSGVSGAEGPSEAVANCQTTEPAATVDTAMASEVEGPDEATAIERAENSVAGNLPQDVKDSGPSSDLTEATEAAPSTPPTAVQPTVVSGDNVVADAETKKTSAGAKEPSSAGEDGLEPRDDAINIAAVAVETGQEEHVQTTSTVADQAVARRPADKANPESLLPPAEADTATSPGHDVAERGGEAVSLNAPKPGDSNVGGEPEPQKIVENAATTAGPSSGLSEACAAAATDKPPAELSETEREETGDDETPAPAAEPCCNIL